MFSFSEVKGLQPAVSLKLNLFAVIFLTIMYVLQHLFERTALRGCFRGT